MGADRQFRKYKGNGRPQTLASEIRTAFKIRCATGAEDYVREVNLPSLIGIDITSLGDPAQGLSCKLRSRLTSALRLERRRGRSGHWSYDLNRHIALYQALIAETLDAD